MASTSPVSASSQPAAPVEAEAIEAAERPVPSESPLPGAGGPEIAFFDVETSVPQRAGQGYALLEFGAILVCPRRLVEVASYATLVRPADPVSAVSAASVRCNGITRDAVSGAPSFRDVADAVYGLLHGRIWAGHNIVRFDCARVREAFAEIGRPPPEPKGMIDTLPLLTQWFGRRAGDMKMASLANYFGLGKQRHRSLDDVRMNLEVLKYCATVLFLEASLPEVLTVENMIERATTRSQANGSASPVKPIPELNSSLESSKRQRTVSPVVNSMLEEDNERTNPATSRESVELVSHIEGMKLDATTQMDASSSGCSGFLELEDVSTESIKISVAPLHQFGRRTLILHKDVPLQLCCAGLKVQFGESGSTSEWRPLIKKYGYVNHPTVRLNIPTIVSGDSLIYTTDIWQKEHGGSTQKLVFSKEDTTELFVRGTKVDSFFSLEIYDYQQNAGIRLVAKRLVVHSK
ncbi:hypothetical protein QOZ80_2BG0179410 [Eleusine coracana subsp. coracana]|nr:hypothetical protein QOZ80_2BG0179410 [Eleusine coracana subsp. coracana]